jgi:hypothetical protein
VKRRASLACAAPAGILAFLAGVAGCAGEAGLGLPHQRQGETYPGERHTITGTLVVASNGCLHVAVDGTPHFVIWPAGAELGNRVKLGWFEELREGETVRAVAAFTPVGPLVADRNGYWAYAIGYCAPNAEEVLVFDKARRIGGGASGDIPQH